MNLMQSVARLFAPRAAAVSRFAAPATMTREQATLERMFSFMATMPDPDEALRRAGIQRHQLRAVEMDDEITAAIDTRREAVLGTPWRLEGGAERHRKAITNELAPHMDPLLRTAHSAVFYGYSVAEVVYRNLGSGAGIAFIAERPMEWFAPAEDGITARFKRPGGPVDGEPMDPRKMLLTVRQGSSRNHYGEALLSRVYWPWFFRQHGWQYWLRWLERYGTPLLLGKTAGDAQAMADSLAAALAGSALAVGNGDEVSAVQAAAGTGHFEAFDAVICRRFQKTILGQTLTTDASTGGSYAAALVADSVRADRRNADLRLVSRTVQRLVDALWQFNGHGGEAPRFVMADDTGLERERADRDAILVEKVGVRLSAEYIAERYDLEMNEFTMVEPKAAPAAQDDAGRAIGSANGPGAVPASFAPQRRFTPVQQGIEDGLARLAAGDPIPPEAIRAAVLAARDEDDLRSRLSALVSQADPRFQATLDRASYAAAVLGYVAAEERRT
jgi:phage gp29-like protein